MRWLVLSLLACASARRLSSGQQCATRLAVEAAEQEWTCELRVRSIERESTRALTLISTTSTNSTNSTAGSEIDWGNVDWGEVLFPLFISFFNGALLLLCGLGSLFFGPIVVKAVTTVQAFIANNYIVLVMQIPTLDVTNGLAWGESVFYMLVGTLTLAYSTIKSEDGRAVMQGMVTGKLAIDPIMVIISDIIYQNVAECNAYGDPTEDFPNGYPIYDKDLAGCTDDDDVCNTKGDKCDPDGTSFLLAYNIVGVVTWLFTLLCGKFATKIKPKMLLLSSCMSGATLTVTAIVDLIEKIIALADPTGEKGLEAKVILPLLTVGAVLTYSLAGAGFLMQISMRKYNAAYVKGKRGADLPKLPYFAQMLLLLPPIKVCFKFMLFLEARLSGKKKKMPGICGKLLAKCVKTNKVGVGGLQDMAQDAVGGLQDKVEDAQEEVRAAVESTGADTSVINVAKSSTVTPVDLTAGDGPVYTEA